MLKEKNVPRKFLTTQAYEPASENWTFEINKSFSRTLKRPLGNESPILRQEISAGGLDCNI